MNEFDNWYNGLVGFQTTSERIYYEICDECIPPEMLRKWMVTCWNAAIEAAQKELETEAYYWVNVYEHGNSYPEHQIEKLKIS